MIRAPAHFALHRHRIPGLRAFPLVCVLQSPLAGGPDRILCPVATRAPTGRTAPLLMLDGVPHALLLRQMISLPLRVLAEQAGTAEHLRDEIIRGLDLLFTGI